MLGKESASSNKDANPSFSLNLVSRLITRFFDRRLATLGINVAHLPVLGALRASSPRSQGELVRIGQIGQPAMAQMLARMVKDGLLVRKTDPDDGRKAQFALSANAIGLMEHVRTTLAEGNRDVFDVLTDEELAAFMASLRKIETSLKTSMGAQQDE